MTEAEAKALAEEHWAWLESLLHKVYVDAMVHGYKHGRVHKELAASNKGIVGD